MDGPIERVTACAYELLTLYGYDLNQTERSFQLAYQYMKLLQTGINMQELMRETEALLTYASTHLDQETAVLNGVEFSPKTVFFRNLEISLIRKSVETFHRTGEIALCKDCSLYSDSFAQLQRWSVRDDLLLLAAVMRHGYGQWKVIAKTPEMSAKLGSDLLGLARQITSEEFLESRARFIVYCLMKTEFESTEV